jgi:hypothetical protein
MSHDDSVHWHGRAKEMLARAEQMNECVTRHVLCRIADVYEGLARKAENEARRLASNPVSRTPLFVFQSRQSSPQKDRLVAHVKQIDEYATELVLRRVADACECLARTAEQRGSWSRPAPGSRAPLPPVEARATAKLAAAAVGAREQRRQLLLRPPARDSQGRAQNTSACVLTSYDQSGNRNARYSPE